MPEMNRTAHVVLFAAVLAVPAVAQQPPAAGVKPRVFVTESQSWETKGRGGGGGGIFLSHSSGGARPQTAEIIKTFGERCPDVTVNNREEMADYTVILDHEGGKGALSHKNKVAVFERVSGDAVVSKSTLSLGGAVEDACKGILQHWAAHSADIMAVKQPAGVSAQAAPAATPSPVAPARTTATTVVASTAAVAETVHAETAAASATKATTSGKTRAAATPVPVAVAAPSSTATITVESTPAGADIEVDGNYLGNTPLTLTLTPGTHEITVKKKGFTPWDKNMNLADGSQTVTAKLEQKPEN